MNLFNINEFERPKLDNGKVKRCDTCVHRRRFSLNEYSPKIIQCCELQKSKRSNSGYKTIKATDKACSAYSENNKDMIL